MDNPTQSIDYVMFQRTRIQYDDQNGTRYYGLNIPNNGVQLKKNPEKVYIAMPQNLSTQYAPTYRQIDTGIVGQAIVRGLSGAGDFDKMAEDFQDAAKKALPEFTQSALSQVATGAAQFLGLAGQIDKNALMALSQGKVFNPYSEQLFSNMQFRTHNFSFKFFARSEQESREINNIIKYIKQGALPIYGTVEAGQENFGARFFEIPDKFQIKFIRINADGSTSDSEDLHHKIHTSVCTGIDVNYTPDGQYNAVKNATIGVGENAPLQVPAVVVNCRFTETQLVTQSQIQEGF